MLAQTSYAGFSPAETALSHRALVKALARLPHRPVHGALVLASRIEAWGRWPVRTLTVRDRIDATFARIDSDGTRFGLTQKVRDQYQSNTLYESVPDQLVLLTGLDGEAFRRDSLVVENAEAVSGATEDGSGAIIVGFRIGPHSALPYVLGALGYEVSMIVASPWLADVATRVGAEFAPRSSEHLQFIAASDSLVLPRAQHDIQAGRLVCTLMEFPAQEFQKTSRVRFLDWEISAPYGIPYLSAMTGRPIIPAIITRHRGPRFRLRFLDAIPPPGRGRASILEANQALYSELDRQVRRFPAQWVGWTLLESHMGIDPDNRL
jgi:predicted LPLAT superfamily acyltransferase